MSTDRQQLLRAKSLFEKFHARAPRGNELIRVGGYSTPPYGLLVGQLVSIGYRALDRERYMHDFEGHLPLLYVTDTGRQIFVIGGSYTFTDRGFIK